MLQYVIEAKVVSGSAKYFIKDRTDVMKPPTIMPESNSIVCEFVLNNLEIHTVKRTVNIAARKEKMLIIDADIPRTIARAAPTEAPDDTPRRSGDTRSLRNIS